VIHGVFFSSCVSCRALNISHLTEQDNWFGVLTGEEIGLYEEERKFCVKRKTIFSPEIRCFVRGSASVKYITSAQT
jgi:hypothetical protein